MEFDEIGRANERALTTGNKANENINWPEQYLGRYSIRGQVTLSVSRMCLYSLKFKVTPACFHPKPEEADN